MSGSFIPIVPHSMGINSSSSTHDYFNVAFGAPAEFCFPSSDDFDGSIETPPISDHSFGLNLVDIESLLDMGHRLNYSDHFFAVTLSDHKEILSEGACALINQTFAEFGVMRKKIENGECRSLKSHIIDDINSIACAGEIAKLAAILLLFSQNIPITEMGQTERSNRILHITKLFVDRLAGFIAAQKKPQESEGAHLYNMLIKETGRMLQKLEGDSNEHRLPEEAQAPLKLSLKILNDLKA